MPNLRSRAAELLLFLLPVAIGMVFWSDSSGYPDSQFYRATVRDLAAGGPLPLAPAIWIHPGHWVLAALVHAAGRTLGLWQDPHQAITLLNFVASGLAALSLLYLWRCTLPTGDAAAAWLGAIGLALCPAWLWSAQQSQSDVIGHSLLVTLAWLLVRLARHDVPTGRTWLWGLGLGLLGAFCVTIRLSALPLGVLHAFLFVCVLRRLPAGRARFGLLSGALIGGLAPLVALFGYYLTTYGGSEFARVFFAVNDVDLRPLDGERLAGIAGVASTWFARWQQGLDPITLAAAITASAGLVIAGIGPLVRRQCCRPLAWGTMAWLALLPYAWATAANRSPVELRYQLPMLALLVSGLPAAGFVLLRTAKLPGLVAVAVLLAVASLYRAVPMLELFRTRTHYLESGAREILRAAGPRDLVLGVQSAPHLYYHGRGRPLITLTGVAAATKDDQLMVTWPTALERMLCTALDGQRVLTFSEAGIEGFLAWIEQRGWRTRTIATVDSGPYRHRADSGLEHGSYELAARSEPVRILELEPPANAAEQLTIRLRVADEPDRRVVEIAAPRYAGKQYRILLGPRDTRIGLQLFDLWVPLADGPIVRQSLAAGEPALGVQGLFGTLDEHGRAVASFPAAVKPHLEALWAVAILQEPGGMLLARSLAAKL